jgi:RimJ/RimL family protein N-acetyltransferase
MINFGYGMLLDALSDSLVPLMQLYRNDYRVWKWCRQNDLISQDHQKMWYESLCKRDDVKMYAIKGVTEAVYGVCGLTDIDRVNQRAEFSLYVDPDYHQRGIGIAALKTLLSHGFMNQNLNVIWGETFEGNPAYKMFLKLGMKHEGTRRKFYFKEGRFLDAYLVSMTLEDYKEQEWIKTQSLL